MAFYQNITIHASFDETIAKVTEALKSEGFGVLTQIDIAAKFKEKLGVDLGPYAILGACNPSLAHKALMIEDKIGVMLPCNVIIRQISETAVEVAAIDPLVTMQAAGNGKLLPIAKEVSEKLRIVLGKI